MPAAFACEAAPDAGVLTALLDKLAAALDESEQRKLHDEMELPLARVLADMERIGFGVDAEGIRAFGDSLRSELDGILQSIYEEVGYEFNVNSPKQLGEALFDKLGLPPRKKTSRGYSTDAETLEKGVGHIESTSLPIGGEYRHAVLTGHRGLPSAELFTRLDELEPGDQFYLHVLDATLAYQVDQILTVEPQELETLVAEPGQDYVTLVTCTPYGINTHRMLVRGTRVPYVPEAEQSTQATAAHLLGGETTTRYFLIGILFGIGLLYLFIAVLLGYRLLHSTAKGENHHA